MSNTRPSAAIDTEIQRLDETLVRVRRHLHSHPELSGQEVATTSYLVERLEEVGLQPRRLNFDGEPTGLSVDVAVGNATADSPLIAIRADIDALPINDAKDVPYKSQRAGMMHACGHDAHTTIVLGAALASGRLTAGSDSAGDSAGRPLDNGDIPPTRLRFLFQPAEETSGGALGMIEQGVLEGVDAILALHVDPERTVGDVGIRYGVLTAFCDEVDILVCGRGGHSARPHQAIDPIAAAVQLLTALYQLLPRSVDSRSPSVFTVGRFVSGHAPNAIPDRAELNGSLRTTEPAARSLLHSRIREVADGISRATGVSIQVVFRSPLPGVVNGSRVTSALEEASVHVLGRKHVHLIDRPSMGGEDFAEYLAHVPGAMLRLGCASPGRDAAFLHSPDFDIDERALGLGCRILAQAAMIVSRQHRRSADTSK